jgi:prepilin signal peptidase PulO-like enzyme (type II secretory pathway)
MGFFLVSLAIIFVIGLFVGSFLGVSVDRVARDEKFLSGRSYCESCRHPLSWQDLIPVFSYLFLGGHCRYCQAKIPLWLPVVELSTAGAFALVFWQSWGLAWWLVFLRLVIAAFLIVIFFADLKYQLVYEGVIYLALGVSFIYQLVVTNGWVGLVNLLLSSLVVGLFFYGLYLLTRKKGLGFGDVQIGFLMGFLLGWPKIIVALYLAFLTGALLGIILMIANLAKLKTKVPLGSFLVLATFISWFWGEELFGLVVSYLF